MAQNAIGRRQQGHLEFFICNSDDLTDAEDSVVTQGCFNMHPLTRAKDDGNASPIDPNHPGRYYMDPPCRESETDQTKPDGAVAGYVVTGRYQLPEGLTCERCTVQMVYCKFCVALEGWGALWSCYKLYMWIPPLVL